LNVSFKYSNGSVTISDIMSSWDCHWIIEKLLLHNYIMLWNIVCVVINKLSPAIKSLFFSYLDGLSQSLNTTDCHLWTVLRSQEDLHCQNSLTIPAHRGNTFQIKHLHNTSYSQWPSYHTNWTQYIVSSLSCPCYKRKISIRSVLSSKVTIRSPLQGSSEQSVSSRDIFSVIPSCPLVTKRMIFMKAVLSN
jgi:hypothetical protein